VRNLFLITICLFGLASCASNEPYYKRENYQTSGVVSAKPFNQVAADCKMQTMHHNTLMDVYELEVPRYKACMEANGYVFGAPALPPAITP